MISCLTGGWSTLGLGWRWILNGVRGGGGFGLRGWVVPVCLVVAPGPLNAIQPLAWEQNDRHRCAPLSVPPEGSPGFTRLLPDATGVGFTNRVSDAQLAKNQILEIGSGVALGDIDGDGWVDLYLCAIEGGNRLFRNLGDWKFVDLTAEAGVSCDGQFSTGAVFADADGDGKLDLLVNSLGGGTRLFMNRGQGHFQEALGSGLSRQNGSTSLALADIDGDGLLDLYVANYKAKTVKDSLADQKIEVGYVNGRFTISPPGLFDPLFLKSGSVSLFEKGEQHLLYRNQGQGVFEAVSWTNGVFLDEAGKPLAEPPKDWGLTAIFRDLNSDGAPDIYVCNDFFYSPDRIWLNDGSGKFRAAPPESIRHISMSSMAIDFADINRDGWDDFFVTDMMSRSHRQRQRQRGSLIHLQVESPISHPLYRPEYPRNMLFLNRGDGTYAEIAQLSGVEASDWTWNVAFVDVDLDGYEDALITTGTLRDANDADFGKGNAARMSGRFNAGPANLRFPRFETANLAFRNQQDLTFRDLGKEWGFSTVGISHGMACADLDNDGDLDVVVNHMRQAAGLYRNNGTAPRIAIRLAGAPPNTQGIGAKIRILGGAVPMQSQEVMSGGRYLSGADPLRVFAAGSLTNRMRIEVQWRSGRHSTVTEARANYLYEIIEDTGASAKSSPTGAGKRKSARAAHRSASPIRPAIDWGPGVALPFFEDVSRKLTQGHHEGSFNELERQPLLPRKLSRLGPGVGWYDVDRDGWEDLLVSNGKGAYQLLFVNDTRGGFKALHPKDPATREQTSILGWQSPAGGVGLLVGLSNYEDGLARGGAVLQYWVETGAQDESITATTSSAGPLALGFLAGRPALFVGGRVCPGRYPEAASSQLYVQNGGQWRLDTANSAPLQQLGLVSGAVWSDLDGDGELELVLACEWAPLRVFGARGGFLKEITTELGLDEFRGWWNGVTTGDFDGDGRLDIVASNWGRNTKYQRHRDHPLRLYYGDFDDDGKLDLLEAYYDAELSKYVPFQTLDVLRQTVPGLANKFPTFEAFSGAGIADILGDRFSGARFLEANWFETTVFLNRGGKFEARPLPAEAQFAPAFGISVGDFDGDGKEDVFLSQNFFGVDPETSRYDAGRGLWLRGDGQGGFQPVAGQDSGVKLDGEQRACAVCDFDQDGRLDLVVTQNGGPCGLFRNVGARPGVRVRLRAPAENPDAIGALVRMQYGNRLGPARLVQAGSGYRSQDSRVQVFARVDPPTGVWVRWPGGKVTTQPITGTPTELVVRSQP